MSKSDNWATPPDLAAVLFDRFKFTTEVCAAADNRAMPAVPYMGLDNGKDALTVDWGARNFCNPPYSQLPAFVARAQYQAAMGKLAVLLLPAYTDTKYWHDIIDGCAEDVYLLKGRLRFWENHKPGKDTARFPSAVVVFSPYGMHSTTAHRCWDWRGHLTSP